MRRNSWFGSTWAVTFCNVPLMVAVLEKMFLSTLRLDGSIFFNRLRRGLSLEDDAAEIAVISSRLRLKGGTGVSLSAFGEERAKQAEERSDELE